MNEFNELLTDPKDFEIHEKELVPMPVDSAAREAVHISCHSTFSNPDDERFNKPKGKHHYAYWGRQIGAGSGD